MSNMWSLKFTGIQPEIERTHIYSFFQTFGKITKLFLKEDKSDATVYFDNAESVVRAATAIQQPNKHNFKLEESNTDPRRSISIPERDRRFNNFATMDDVVIASNESYMFDIMGNKFTTLIGDDNESYVSVNELQRIGFRLFDTKPDKLAYNTQMRDYVRMYLQIQVHKFICKYNCNIDAQDKDRIIASVGASVDEQIAENSRMTPRDWDHSEEINAPLRRPRDTNVSKNPMDLSMIVNGTTRTVANDRARAFQQEPLEQKKIHDDHAQYSGSKEMEPKINNDDSNIALETKRNNTQGMDRQQLKQKSSNYNLNKSNGFERKCNEDSMSQISSTSDLRRMIKHNYISVPLNKKLKVVVSQLMENNPNPKIAFLHLAGTEEKLEQINRAVSEQSTKSPILMPSKGLVCAVAFKSVWKRAIVSTEDPWRVQLLDYGVIIRLKDDFQLRGLSEALKAEPWLAIRASKAQEHNPDLVLQRNATYIAESHKRYDDGTYIFRYYSQVKDDDTVSKRQVSNTPLGMNVQSEETSTPKPVTYTPKESTPVPTSKPTVKVTEPVMEDTLQHATILDKFRNGLKVMVEFQFETHCQDNSVVAFLCIGDLSDEDANMIDKITNIPLQNIRSCNDTSSVKVGDLIAIKSVEEEYYRCMIYNIKNGVYSVARVDAGTVEDIQAEDILLLDENIKELPYLSCICFYPEIDDLKEVDDSTFYVNGENQLSGEGSTYNIKGMIVKPWNPLVTHGSLAKTTNKFIKQVSVVEGPSKICVTQSPAVTVRPLQAGNMIRIIKIDFSTNTFYVQSREMFTSYTKDILLNINYAANGFRTILNPHKNMAVIVKCGNELYRGIIDNIFRHCISLELIDIGGFRSVQLQDMFEMDSSFADKEHCCVPFKLDGLETLEDEATSFLKKCIQSKEKFTLTEIKNNLTSMTDVTGNNLLDKLNKLNMASKPPGFWYMNLQHISIPMGRASLLFSYVNIKNGDIFFTVSDGVLREKIAELLKELAEHCEGGKEYHPSKGEICCAFCMDDWCRVNVVSANKEDDKYEVFFFDFGNLEVVRSEFIRRLPDESYGKVAPLCTKFIVKDLREMYSENIPDLVGKQLENTLQMGSEYTLNVLQKLNNNAYLAEIPDVSRILTYDADDF